ncbi:YgaP family membrane protein [Longibacter sp.]|uniref:YgaP family membrane protein n=1 Tax=Longibacter sp. TaxID=2045415 RepID=UPI003EB94DFE
MTDHPAACRIPSTDEKIVRILGGSVVLAGLALGYFGPAWGYLITVFAAVNLIQSAFTGFCPPQILHGWLTGDAKRPEYAETGRDV